MMSAPTNVSDNGRSLTISLNKALYWFSRHWLLVITLLLLIFVGLPWLAPLFMSLGWNQAGETIYLIYSTQCHQLPQRSFFLFGENAMIPLSTIQSIWSNSENPLVLRQFIGSTEVGWKVAWSDRMVYMYTTLLIAGLAFWPLRKRLKPIPWWVLMLFLLPMAVDGLTHMISDVVGGIGGGFRYTNNWLAALTDSTFPATFYTGDAFGSFNSWIRLLSGILFGIGVVWFAYPHLHASFNETAKQIAGKFQQVEASVKTREAS
ncbi:MAG: DUF2085 domain-containing protein [Anaerolinea sp.]|nr:DUF2085 domain-containing protein [Anaerolinea sp.]